MLDILRKVDPNLLEMPCGDGRILVTNALQGRIFAAFGDQLVHRLVRELAENPDPVEFNNIGGNSLWPAPEGGDFAFNYPPQGDWYVQPGINSVKTSTVSASASRVCVRKEIELLNRHGATLKLEFKRTVSVLSPAELPEYAGVLKTGYHTFDELIPLNDCPVSDVLMSAWTLEQFPGAEGIMAFGRCAGPADGCANDDFYGSAAERLTTCGRVFKFALGGPKRLQIGLKASAKPELIGALDPNRGTLVVRSTPAQPEGRYFNIADNDQKSGPFGAADMFSIFNGSQELDFHELETIAPLRSDDSGKLLPSTMESTSLLFKGEAGLLKDLLARQYGVCL